MPVYSTGLLENRAGSSGIRPSQKLVLRVSNEGVYSTDCLVEIFTLNNKDQTKHQNFYITQFALNGVNKTGAVRTFDDIECNLDTFGVRVTTIGTGSANVAVTMFTMDANGNLVDSHRAFQGEMQLVGVDLIL
ncbi:hypothetical protein ACFQPF_00560 [Fictibacillus iocasae]|uniref:Exosporium protein C n=1 Tax=Fictibacillus iocasae TaxID=2715437 RepID=A0ABW2NK48_9BACL